MCPDGCGGSCLPFWIAVIGGGMGTIALCSNWIIEAFDKVKVWLKRLL